MLFGIKGQADKNAVFPRLIGAALGAGVGVLFFTHWIPILVVSGSGLFLYPFFLKRRKAARERLSQEQDSCVMLRSLAAALRAGKSFENALLCVPAEISASMHSALPTAWERMCGKVRASRPPEEAFAEMAEECDLQELRQLSAVITICLQSGGNLSDTISETVDFLRDKERNRNEVAILLARKQNEQRIMNVLPFALILIMRLIAGSYLAPLYATAEGILIMSGCLLLILSGWMLSEKLTGGALR